MKAVNAGEVEGAIIYHYYWFGDQAKTGENSKNVGLHYFKNQDPGAFVSVSGGGILKSTQHMKEAQAFLKFVASKTGQDSPEERHSYEYAVATSPFQRQARSARRSECAEGRSIRPRQQEGRGAYDGCRPYLSPSAAGCSAQNYCI